MTTQQMLDDRYGRTNRGRRFWIVFAAVALTIAVAGTAWFALSASSGTADASTTSFDLVDDHTVTVGFQVSAPAGSPIACAIEAQDEEHGIVGWRIVEYPASDRHTRSFTETVPVLSPAATGLVNSCWVP
ncbi:DUF4307 domain-containing protein [Microbacterium sp. GXF7504]